MMRAKETAGRQAKQKPPRLGCGSHLLALFAGTAVLIFLAAAGELGAAGGALFIVVSSFWVFFDAQKREKETPVGSPGGWLCRCLLLWFYCFPLYLFTVHAARRAAEKTVAAEFFACPNCAEQIRVAAKTCRFCGAAISAREKSAP